MRVRTPYRRIAAREASRLLDNPAVLRFDVRDTAAFAAGHLPQARHLTFSGLAEVIAATAKDRPILIYCYHGNASREYAQALSDFGFTDVASLDGGYEAYASFAQANRPAGSGDALGAWLESQGFGPREIDGRGANGMTPLMWACREGMADMVAALLAAGADIEARNADGNTALWLACVGSHLDIIDHLVRAGIHLDNCNDNGATALMYAASAGKAEVVRALLEKGASLQPQTLDGFSALDLAANEACLILLRSAERKARAAVA